MFVKGKNCGIVGTAGFIDLPADHKNTMIQVKKSFRKGRYFGKNWNEKLRGKNCISRVQWFYRSVVKNLLDVWELQKSSWTKFTLRPIKRYFINWLKNFEFFSRKWMFTWSHQWLNKERLSFTENAATKKKKDQSLRIPPWKIWIMSKNLYIPGFWICTNLFFTENINSTFINHIV